MRKYTDWSQQLQTASGSRPKHDLPLLRQYHGLNSFKQLVVPDRI
ncbi:hypothetical protein [Paraneptunicella aestuarii]